MIESKQKKIGVYGNGAFATAIANKIAINIDVLIYAYRDEIAIEANKTRICKGQSLLNNIVVTSDISCFLESCDTVFIIVPSIHLESAVKNLVNKINRDRHIIVHGVKSLLWDKKKPHELLSVGEYLVDNLGVRDVCFIAGPNIASEIASNQYTSIVVGGKDAEKSKYICDVLNSHLLYAVKCCAPKSMEICSSLKNIYAILLGAIRGKGFLLNVQGAIFSEFVQEMAFILNILELDRSPVNLSCGVGDLFATCMSENSRNSSLGHKISQGFSIKSLAPSEFQSYEGLMSLENFHFYCISKGYKFKMIDMAYKIVFKNADICEEVKKNLIF